MSHRTLLASLVVLCGLTACATTPPSEDPVLIKLTELDERLNKVERVTANDSLVQLASQMAEIQNELREIRGQVETLTYESESAATRQRDQYLDIDRRLQALEGRRPASAAGSGAPTAGAVAGAAGAAGTVAAKPPVTPAADRAPYQESFDLLKEGRYEEARAGFQRFLVDHPDSDLAGHSQYWLGETYYVTQEYPEALSAFQKVLSDYPQSRKLPDAILKVGYCHYELGQYPQARAALSRVVEQYPESTAARLAGQRLDRMRSEGR